MANTSVKSERAALAVAQHIERLVLEGSLRPGEQLVPERELAERLSVSRSTLRDALAVLEQRGIVTSEGRGTRVTELGKVSVTDPLIALLAKHSEANEDYLEFRGIVESAAASLAATRATDVERGLLADILARIDRAHQKENPEEEADADAALHLLIYEASHNLTLLQIMHSLAGVLRADVTQNRSRLFQVPAMREVLLSQHHAIAGAIMDGDPQRAAIAATEHIAYIRHSTLEIRESERRLDLSLRRLSAGNIATRPRVG